MKNIAIIVGFAVLFIVGCTPTDKYAGQYSGVQYTQCYNINVPSGNYLDTTNIEFDITAGIGDIKVFNEIIPMQSNGYGFLESDYGIWFTVQFATDSVFIYRHSNMGHPGGQGCTYNIKAVKNN